MAYTVIVKEDPDEVVYVQSFECLDVAAIVWSGTIITQTFRCTCKET